MKEKFQTIVFDINKYENRDEMWKDIATLLRIIVKNEHICEVYDDDTDIIVVNFGHDEKKDAWGCAYPHWLTEEEMLKLEDDEE